MNILNKVESIQTSRRIHKLDIQEIELSIEEAQKMVERRNQAYRLADNADFKSLILEGYYKDEAVRLVGLSADPSTAKYADEIILAIKSISMLQQYMRNIVAFGNTAESEIGDMREVLDEERNEGEIN